MWLTHLISTPPTDYHAISRYYDYTTLFLFTCIVIFPPFYRSLKLLLLCFLIISKHPALIFGMLFVFSVSTILPSLSSLTVGLLFFLAACLNANPLLYLKTNKKKMHFTVFKLFLEPHFWLCPYVIFLAIFPAYLYTVNMLMYVWTAHANESSFKYNQCDNNTPHWHCLVYRVLRNFKDPCSFYACFWKKTEEKSYSVFFCIRK